VVDIVDWDGEGARTAADAPHRIVLDDHVTDLVTLAGLAS